MRVVVDTNVILRAAQPGHAQALLAQRAVQLLTDARDEPCVVPQVLYEFWVVATRPTAQNGLGLAAASANGEIEKILTVFTLLDDRANLFVQWRELVIQLGVIGKSAYDARIVAAMATHGVQTLLTFNRDDFNRFNGITVISPKG
jgi:predicted nucleic acid-binding protein